MEWDPPLFSELLQQNINILVIFFLELQKMDLNYPVQDLLGQSKFIGNSNHESYIGLYENCKQENIRTDIYQIRTNLTMVIVT